jgi:uncharacterized protein YaaN involved in tellurite resistance
MPEFNARNQETTTAEIKQTPPIEAARTGAVDASGNAVALDALPSDKQARIRELMTRIDLKDSQTILSFGVEAQREVTQANGQILDKIRNKDTGPAGEALNEMMLQIRGIDASSLKEGKKPGFFGRLFRKLNPIAKFIQQYESVENQIGKIEQQLEKHRYKLVQDVTMLDRLFDATLQYFRELELYIAAGQYKLEQIDQEEIPAIKKNAEETNSPVDAQNARDLKTLRDDLERKIHDLKLTRQVVMQSLPSIRMTQELDKGLVTKIQSSVINTIPLWKNQLAQAVTIFRTREAAGTLKATSDLTNELLEKGSENLRQANKEVRTELERGIVSVESIEKANENLIGAIQESIQIAEEGKQKRADAEQRLLQCENDLKSTLRNVSGG